MASANYTKAPPDFKKEDHYEKWKKLEIWQLYTSLKKTKQRPALFLSLHEDTQDAVLAPTKEEMASEQGVAKIRVILDRLFLTNKTQRAFEALE